MPTISIFFLTETIYSNILRCIYLRNEKYFLNFFLHFLNGDSILTFSNKRLPSSLIYFWTYGLWKTRLDKCLKSPLWGDPSTINMVNKRKHCWNLDDRTFTISIDPCECNWELKSCSELYAKSYECLLTHLLLIISILLLTEAILCNIFRCNYRTKEKLFLQSILHFLN